jgi:hypothetical protein
MTSPGIVVGTGTGEKLNASIGEADFFESALYLFGETKILLTVSGDNEG